MQTVCFHKAHFFQKATAKNCGYTTQANTTFSVSRAKRSLPTTLNHIIGTQNPIIGYFTCFRYASEQVILYLCIPSIFTIHILSNYK